MQQLRLNKAGDTIVEVLLALAVLGLIIGGGYSIATRSLNGVRISQERGEATKLAEGQLEALKAHFSTVDSVIELVGDAGPFDLWDPGVPIALGVNDTFPGAPGRYVGFCFDFNGDIQRFERPAGGIQDIGGYTEPKCISGIYHVYIDTNFRELTVAGGSPATPIHELTYFVNVSWERSGGGGVEHLSLSDRIVTGLN